MIDQQRGSSRTVTARSYYYAFGNYHKPGKIKCKWETVKRVRTGKGINKNTAAAEEDKVSSESEIVKGQENKGAKKADEKWDNAIKGKQVHQVQQVVQQDEIIKSNKKSAPQTALIPFAPPPLTPETRGLAEGVRPREPKSPTLIKRRIVIRTTPAVNSITTTTTTTATTPSLTSEPKMSESVGPTIAAAAEASLSSTEDLYHAAPAVIIEENESLEITNNVLLPQAKEINQPLSTTNGEEVREGLQIHLESSSATNENQSNAVLLKQNKIKNLKMIPQEESPKSYSISGMWNSVGLGLVKDRSSVFKQSQGESQPQNSEISKKKTKPRQDFAWTANNRKHQQEVTSHPGEFAWTPTSKSSPLPTEGNKEKSKNETIVNFSSPPSSHNTVPAQLRSNGDSLQLDVFPMTVNKSPQLNTKFIHPNKQDCRNVHSLIQNPMQKQNNSVFASSKTKDVFASNKNSNPVFQNERKTLNPVSKSHDQIESEAAIKRTLPLSNKVNVNMIIAEDGEKTNFPLDNMDDRLKEIEKDLEKQKKAEKLRLLQIEADKRVQEQELKIRNRIPSPESMDKLSKQKQERIADAFQMDQDEVPSPEEFRRLLETKLEDKRNKEERKMRRTLVEEDSKKAHKNTFSRNVNTRACDLEQAKKYYFGASSSSSNGTASHAHHEEQRKQQQQQQQSSLFAAPVPPPPPPERDLKKEDEAIKKAKHRAKIPSQQERFKMFRAELESQQLLWQQLKRAEEEQEEILLRALENQIHHEKLNKQQEDILKNGIQSPPPVPDLPVIFFPVVCPEVPERRSYKRPLLHATSIEEDVKLEQWEEMKRRENEQEEKLMRDMETSMEFERQQSYEEERNKLAQTLEAQRIREEEINLKNLQLKARDSPVKRPIFQSEISVEEQAKLKEWEELKRQDSENEEKMLRAMERTLSEEKEKQREREVIQMQTSIDEQIMENDNRHWEEVKLQQPGPLTINNRNKNTGSPKNSGSPKRQISVEEEVKLQQWEDLKRREAEEEEKRLREMERSLSRQKVNAEDIERQKFQEAIEKQCMEEDLRMQGPKDKTPSPKRTSLAKAKSQTSQDSQLEWEKIKRMQEEQEERMRLDTERELERQRVAQEDLRKKMAMEDHKHYEDRRRLIHQMTIEEEEDESCKTTLNPTKKVNVEIADDLEWLEIQRRQEEEEEIRRANEEKFQSSGSPKEKEMLKQVHAMKRHNNNKDNKNRSLVREAVTEEPEQEELEDIQKRPISSESDDYLMGYSEGCDDLSVGMDLPTQERSSTDNDTPIPTTGELEELSLEFPSDQLQQLDDLNKLSLKSSLKKSEEFSDVIFNLENDAKKVHFSSVKIHQHVNEESMNQIEP